MSNESDEDGDQDGLISTQVSIGHISSKQWTDIDPKIVKSVENNHDDDFLTTTQRGGGSVFFDMI